MRKFVFSRFAVFRFFLFTFVFVFGASLILSLALHINKKNNQSNNDFFNSTLIANNKDQNQKKQKDDQSPTLSIEQPTVSPTITTIFQDWKNFFDQKRFSASPSRKEINFNLGTFKSNLIKLLSSYTQTGVKINYSTLLSFFLKQKTNTNINLNRGENTETSQEVNGQSLQTTVSQTQELDSQTNNNVASSSLSFGRQAVKNNEKWSLVLKLFYELMKNLMDQNFLSNEKEWLKIDSSEKKQNHRFNNLTNILDLLFVGDENHFVVDVKKIKNQCYNIDNKSTLHQAKIKIDCLKASLKPNANATIDYKNLIYFFYAFFKYLHFKSNLPTTENNLINANTIQTVLSFYQANENQEKKKEIIDEISKYLFEKLKLDFYYNDEKQESSTIFEIISFLKENNVSFDFKLSFFKNGNEETSLGQDVLHFVKQVASKQTSRLLKQQIYNYFHKKMETKFFLPFRFFDFYFSVRTNILKLLKKLENHNVNDAILKSFFKKLNHELKQKQQLFPIWLQNNLSRVTDSSLVSVLFFQIIRFLQSKHKLNFKLINQFILLLKSNQTQLNILLNGGQSTLKLNYFRQKSNFNVYTHKVQNQNRKFLILNLLDENFKKHLLILENKNDQIKIIYYQSSWKKSTVNLFFKYYLEIKEISSSFFDNTVSQTNTNNNSDLNAKTTQTDFASIRSDVLQTFDKNYFTIQTNNNQKNLLFQEENLIKKLINLLSPSLRLKQITYTSLQKRLLTSIFANFKNNRLGLKLSSKTKSKANNKKSTSSSNFIFEDLLQKFLNPEFLEKVKSWTNLRSSTSKEPETIESILNIVFGEDLKKYFYFEISKRKKCNSEFKDGKEYVFAGIRLKVELKCLKLKIVFTKEYKMDYSKLIEFSYRLLKFLYFKAFGNDLNNNNLTSKIIDDILSFYKSQENSVIKNEIMSEISDFILKKNLFKYKYLYKVTRRGQTPGNYVIKSKTLNDLLTTFVNKDLIKISYWGCTPTEKALSKDFYSVIQSALKKCEKADEELDWIKLQQTHELFQSIFAWWTKEFISKTIMKKGKLFFNNLRFLTKVIKLDLKIRTFVTELMAEFEDLNISSKENWDKLFEKFVQIYKELAKQSFSSLPKWKTLKNKINSAKIYKYLNRFLNFQRKRYTLNNNLVQKVIQFLQEQKTKLQEFYLLSKTSNLKRTINGVDVQFVRYKNKTFLKLFFTDHENNKHLFGLRVDLNPNNEEITNQIIFYQPNWKNNFFEQFVIDLKKNQKTPLSSMREITISEEEPSTPIVSDNVNVEFDKFFSLQFKISENKQALNFHNKEEDIRNKIIKLFSEEEVDHNTLTLGSLFASLFPEAKNSWSKAMQFDIDKEEKYKTEVKISTTPQQEKNIKSKQELYRGLFLEFLDNALKNNKKKDIPAPKDEELSDIFAPFFGTSDSPKLSLNMSPLQGSLVLNDIAKPPAAFRIIGNKLRARIDWLKFEFKLKDEASIGYTKILELQKKLFQWIYKKFISTNKKTSEIEFNTTNIITLIKEMQQSINAKTASSKQKTNAQKYISQLNQFVLDKLHFNFQYNGLRRGIKTINEVLLFLQENENITVEYHVDVLACSSWLGWIPGLCELTSEWKDYKNLTGLSDFIKFFHPPTNLIKKVEEKITESIEDYPLDETISENATVSEKLIWNQTKWLKKLILLVDLQTKTEIFFDQFVKLKNQHISIDKIIKILEPFYLSLTNFLSIVSKKSIIPSWAKIKKRLQNPALEKLILFVFDYFFNKKTLSSALANKFMAFVKENKWNLNDLFTNNTDIMNEWNSANSNLEVSNYEMRELENEKRVLILKMTNKKTYDRFIFVLGITAKRRVMPKTSDISPETNGWIQDQNSMLRNFRVIFYESSWNENNLNDFLKTNLDKIFP